MTMRHRIAALVATVAMAGGILAVVPSAAQAAPPTPTTERLEVGIQLYCSYYDGTATVRRGSKGNAVREVQCILNYWQGRQILIVDGDFGENTEHWVKEFQKAWQIEDDGIVGRDTWNFLRDGV